MNQTRKKKVEQFEYLGRWVDKSGFRAFVYDARGEQKLADSFSEFESLLASGVWFAKKPEKARIENVKRKPKDGPVCPAGEGVHK